MKKLQHLASLVMRRRVRARAQVYHQFCIYFLFYFSNYKSSTNWVIMLWWSILQSIFTLTLQHCFPKTLQSLNQCNQSPAAEYKKNIVCTDPKCCDLYEDMLLLKACSIPVCGSGTQVYRCDRILENHPYEYTWVYHNLADITKTYFKYFYTFPCNSKHFYCIGTINEQKNENFKLLFNTRYLMRKMHPWGWFSKIRSHNSWCTKQLG